ncbi:hypothetical protein RFI_08853 [Reticulomyxa filosa]|uniref:Uncharacterized protein n=1 Tax=Reticulomyxa filosa TaxID=46433 RepID=X6NQI7_RETFI|nr:hypothetical protein RFI_08853 [Reticulomyxa filosa]|eukprot:ETO28281.1 hypothetical protein RFI_08853 [Reticulomyxa filosa]
MALIMNGQSVSCFTSDNGRGQQHRLPRSQQPIQPYIVPNYGYSNMTTMPQTHQVCVASNDYQTMVSLKQSEMRMYQMKQEQIRISQQRHAEEMNHTNSHPQIRHHCAIIDRLDKNDSRYTDFANQVKVNEEQFEAESDTFVDKQHIALKMNAQRCFNFNKKNKTKPIEANTYTTMFFFNSSTPKKGESGVEKNLMETYMTNKTTKKIRFYSSALSRNSSKESFVRSNGDCTDNNSDEETSGNVRNGYMSSPSSGSSVASNDALPPCNPGDSCSLVGCENNTSTRSSLTCLSVLENWCGESHTNESDANETDKEDCDEETFEINYAWINEELEKLEILETQKKINESWQRGIDFNVAPVVPMPVHMQMPMSMDTSLPWVHANYALPMVAMPMIRFPYQAYVGPNVSNACIAVHPGPNVYADAFYA